ncbi:MAG TPA: ATP-binding protein, partial [Polyangiaceae bacterium]|nr:ATP-binding protein [Polyangiaceae bacterium]
QRMIEIPELEYTALVSRLSTTDRSSEVLRQLLTWQLEPAQKGLLRLAEQAKSLARRLGKGELDLDVGGQNVRLDPQQWAPFFGELVHVVRNAVDHGLEPTSERVELGKPSRGSLALKAKVEGDTLVFEVTDDGRGIDWTGIAEQAKAQGLPHATQTDLLDALCADGLTTRGDANEVSGRGMGMAALRARVRSMNGRLEVRSAKSVGTSWFMRFPWPTKQAAAAASSASSP